MVDDRRALLQRLVERKGPLEDVYRALTQFPWDVDEPLVTLTSDHVADALRDYLAGALTEREVEDWADALEVRDDVEFADSAEEDVLHVIHFLANPLLHGPLTPEGAEDCLHRLAKRGETPSENP